MAGPPSPRSPSSPVPASVEITPAASIFRIRWLRVSATYTLPAVSAATLLGKSNSALAAVPPSPFPPSLPVPASVAMIWTRCNWTPAGGWNSPFSPSGIESGSCAIAAATNNSPNQASCPIRVLGVGSPAATAIMVGQHRTWHQSGRYGLLGRKAIAAVPLTCRLAPGAFRGLRVCPASSDTSQRCTSTAAVVLLCSWSLVSADCALQPRVAIVRLLAPWGFQLNSRKSSVLENGNRRLSGVFSIPRYRRSALWMCRG